MKKKNKFLKRIAIYSLAFSAHTTETYNLKHGLKPGDADYKLAKIPGILRKLAGE